MHLFPSVERRYEILSLKHCYVEIAACGTVFGKILFCFYLNIPTTYAGYVSYAVFL